MGGYYANGKPWTWLLDALARSSIEPFLPSLSTVIGPWKGWPLAAWVVAAWILVGWGIARSRWRRIATFGAGWFVLSVALLGVTGTCSRRALYVPTAATLLLVVPALLGAWERRTPRAAGVIGWVAGAAWLASFAHGTPVFARYPEWGEVARASDLWGASDRWEALAPGATVWLADRPFRVDLDPRRFRLWRGLGHCHCAASYSVEAWLQERWPQKALRANTLTGWDLRAPVAAQKVVVTVEDDALVVWHTGGQRQDWEVSSPFHVKGKEKLVIRPKKAVTGHVVAVWTPEGPVFWAPGGDGVW